MKARVQQWGHSLGVRIPKVYANDIHLSKGQVVEVSCSKGKLVILPLREHQFTLEELLLGVTKKNIHKEVDFANPIESEIW